MKLLIAEDDADIRSLIALTVPQSWTILEAQDGLEAVSIARVHQPDALILDHRMPVLSGAEVCRLLATEPWRSHCTIVALTASRDEEVRRDLVAAGVDAFLHKPFSPVELLNLLQAWELHRA